MKPNSGYFHQYKYCQQGFPPSLQGQQLTAQTWGPFMDSTVADDNGGRVPPQSWQHAQDWDHLPDCEHEINEFCCIVCTLRIKQQLPTGNRNYSHWRLNTCFFSAPPIKQRLADKGMTGKSHSAHGFRIMHNRARYTANHLSTVSK